MVGGWKFRLTNSAEGVVGSMNVWRQLAWTMVLLLTGSCSMWGGNKAASNSGQFLPGDGMPTNSQVNIGAIPDAVPVATKLSSTGNKPYTVFGHRYQPLKDAQGYQQEGVASWYGTKFHGRKTSSGEPYNMYAMSAAHRTLPLPSYLRVTNLRNQRSVIVKVNDRGPFVDTQTRIIDLSYVAAAKLGIVATGTARVRLEGVTTDTENQRPLNLIPPAPVSGETSYLQMGAFSERENAVQLFNRGAKAGIAAYIVQSGGVYKVKSGPYVDADQALRRKMDIDRLLSIEALVVFER